jgi:hypothetical protein
MGNALTISLLIMFEKRSIHIFIYLSRSVSHCIRSCILNVLIFREEFFFYLISFYTQFLYLLMWPIIYSQSFAQTLCTTDCACFCKFIVRTCLSPLPPDPCLPLPLSYQQTCGLMTDTTSVFAACISTLGATSASDNYDNCILDACYTNGDSICQSLQTFVAECAAHGVQIACSDWRTASNCGNHHFHLFFCASPNHLALTNIFVVWLLVCYSCKANDPALCQHPLIHEFPIVII